MQKVYIRGVKGRGTEVIAKLEEFGGNNNIKFDGENDRCLYFIDDFTTIECVRDNCETADIIMMASTEIFLDDTTPEPKFKVRDKIHIMSDKSVYTITDRKDNGDCSLNNSTVYYNEQYLTPADTLKEYDPVMASNDGNEWCCALHCKNYETYPIYMFDDNSGTIEWKYIVPLSNFDFNDLESNIKRSVI